MTTLTSARQFFREAPWQQWTAQLLAIMGIEVRKNFLTRRSIWIYLVALGPLVLIGGHDFLDTRWDAEQMRRDTEILAGIFQLYYLRLGMFFGCMGLFTWLFRGEVVEKSLHYYFLAPVRRELLVLAKFLAGTVSATIIFGVAVFLSFVLLYLPYGESGRAFVFSGPGLGHLAAYLGVTGLACLGYGAIFIAFSLVIRNPIIPGAFVLLWETFHPVFPSLLQKLSVMFYLKQLCPVAIAPEGMMALFTVVAAPVSAWIAVPGLILLSAAIMVFACTRIRHTEINYLAD
ncbi:MAG TPA: hypothetical protein VKZ53_15400 [Candidatus Angelobacter sp.]|nr:hypothetical protein [Candidatus Angelobacter sp.]